MTLTQIFAKVLNMSLTASLVIVLVIAARFILRKSPKVFSYALWAVVLFRLLCPVSLPSPVSLLGLLDAPVAESDGITSSVEYVPTNAGGYREIIVQNPVRTEIPDVPVRQQNQQVDVPSPAKICIRSGNHNLRLDRRNGSVVPGRYRQLFPIPQTPNGCLSA